MKESEFKDVTINYRGKEHQLNIEFKPYQSVMLKITPNGKVEYMDIEFTPKDPVVREREKQRMHF
jgi:hypothetical protein